MKLISILFLMFVIHGCKKDSQSTTLNSPDRQTTAEPAAAPQSALPVTGRLISHNEYRQSPGSDIQVVEIVTEISGATIKETLNGIFMMPWFDQHSITKGNKCDKQHMYFRGDLGGEESYLTVDNLRPGNAPSGIGSIQLGVLATIRWRNNSLVGTLEGANWKANWNATFTDTSDASGPKVVMKEVFLSESGVAPAAAADRYVKIFSWFGDVAQAGPDLRYKAAKLFAGLHSKFAPYHETLPPRIAQARSLNAVEKNLRGNLTCP